MKLLMHVLKENKKLDIDNANASLQDIRKKLFGEFGEIVQAITNYNKHKDLENLKEIIRETFDLIQMCILILWRCHRIAKADYKKPNLVQEINLEHKDKLISERAWEPITGIEIEVKE